MALSGVKVLPEVVKAVNDFKLAKLDKKYTWMTIVFKPSIDAPEELVIGDKGTGDYESFKSVLTKQSACFAVVDVPSAKGPSRLALISWAPDTLATKPKMMVASTLGALKGALTGVEPYQASDESDLDIKQVQAKIDRKG